LLLIRAGTLVRDFRARSVQAIGERWAVDRGSESDFSALNSESKWHFRAKYSRKTTAFTHQVLRQYSVRHSFRHSSGHSFGHSWRLSPVGLKCTWGALPQPKVAHLWVAEQLAATDENPVHLYQRKHHPQVSPRNHAKDLIAVDFLVISTQASVCSESCLFWSLRSGNGCCEIELKSPRCGQEQAFFLN
jgi:hypothetical protein